MKEAASSAFKEWEQREPEGVDLRPWFTAIHDISGPLNWPEFWGNEQRLELDIGCGRGLFIDNASMANPQTNYLGLELEFKEGRHAAKRLWKRKADNARIIGGDATVIMRHQIAPHSVDGIHVYFPDPWWKPKHRRRRIFTDEFADLCANILKPGAMLHSWSDVGEYFEIIAALMNHHQSYEPMTPPEQRAATGDMDYQTSFERKKRKLGCQIHRGLWRRRPIT